MNKLVLALILAMSFHFSAMAEGGKTAPIDSLLSLYERYGNIYSVFDNYTFSYTSSDLKKLYSDRNVKSVLLRLFDRSEYLKARGGKITEENSLERAQMDTAYSKQPLYDYSFAESLICSFRWQEVYDKVYDLWVADGKRVGSHWFGVLLGFQDPEAISLVDGYLKSVDKKGSVISSDMHDYVREAIHGSYGSYSEDVKIRLLSKDFIVLADFDYQPVNVAVIGHLNNRFDENCGRNASHYLSDVKGQILKLASDMDIFSYNKYQRISRDIVRHTDVAKGWYQCNKAIMEKEESFWKSKIKYRK
ncbi:MAG: hypothetical protein J6Y37_17130 [Paludibacteraceae bacterium]|nr:hypothetical protein [Paludibacteraceae bacterium]